MFRDIHHAFRLLGKSPGFTMVAVLTLGIGIGANITIFSMINAVLVRPLAAPQSEKLVRLYETNERPLAKGSVSVPNFLDWRERTSGFESMGAYAPRNFALQGRSGSKRVQGAAVSANYFQVIGVGPRWGRSFGPEEDQPGRDHVVIISEVLCRRLYGEQTEVLGRSVQLNSETYTIVGIAPAGFCFPNVDTEAWIPLAFSGNDLQARNNHWLNVIGRLSAGASIAGVQEQMSSIAAVLARQYPSQQTGRGIHVVSLHDDMVGETRPTFWLLQSAVGCMLLIACGNLANLLLSRATGRQREITTRAALGASRWQIARLLFAESLLLGIGGGILGFLSALWGIQLFSVIGKAYLPHFSAVPTAVLGYTAFLSLLVGLLCGLLPVSTILGKRGDYLQSALRDSSYGFTGRADQGKGVLAICEIAGALILLICGGLLLRSFLKLQETNSGIVESDKILTAGLTLPPARYSSGQLINAFYRAEQTRVAGLPGVRAAGAINDLPLTPAHDGTTFRIEDWPPFARGQEPAAETRVVSGDYFQAAGIPLIAGRFLDERDGPDAPRVILINRTMALRFWKDAREAIGHRIDNGTCVATVVGVVGDVHQFGLARAPLPEIYFPIFQAQDASDLGQNDAQSMVLVIRAEGSSDPAMLADSVRQEIGEIDSTLPLYRVLPWSTIIANSIGDRRLNLWLVGAFGLMALLLSALGLYGVISYGVARRTREIGVRIALGAEPIGVLRLVLAGGTRLAAIGIAIGTVVSLFVTRLLQGFLYEVSPTDPMTFAGIIALLVSVTFFANYIPARRATKISPMIALRE
jgi:putative ABC transport system permease protein